MQYRRLGRWGLQVSAVGLGSWLTYGGSVDRRAAAAYVRRAHELGVNLFDTANEYQRGRAEEVLGDALRPFSRDSYVLATKVFFPMGERPNQRGLSRKHVTEQLHASLRRLGTDYVDLYQCHRYDSEAPVDETCLAMEDLVRSGKVLYWGVSEWSADQMSQAVGLARSGGWHVPVSNQVQYSALWRGIEAGVTTRAAELGMGLIAWSPLAMGVLTGKYSSTAAPPPDSRAAGRDAGFLARYLKPPVVDAVAELRPLAEKAGVSVAQLALAWCLRSACMSSVLVGATRLEHVEDNVRATEIDLEPAVLDQLDAITAPVSLT